MWNQFFDEINHSSFWMNDIPFFYTEEKKKKISEIQNLVSKTRQNVEHLIAIQSILNWIKMTKKRHSILKKSKLKELTCMIQAENKTFTWPFSWNSNSIAIDINERDFCLIIENQTTFIEKTVFHSVAERKCERNVKGKKENQTINERKWKINRVMTIKKQNPLDFKKAFFFDFDFFTLFYVQSDRTF